MWSSEPFVRPGPTIRFHILLILGLGTLVARDAHATLAGDSTSISANEHALGAVRTALALPVGARHDLALPSGGMIHEYVSPSGVVYAVTWRGPGAPNLRELLGAHFDDLAKRPPQAGHHALRLTLADFEVRSWNHRHMFGGRAWVPSLVPEGVDVESWVAE